MSHSIFYYEPFYDFDRLFEAFSLQGSNGNRASQVRRALDNNAVRPLRPRMDLHENTGRNRVTATFELPGLKKEDVSIDLQNGHLTLC